MSTFIQLVVQTLSAYNVTQTQACKLKIQTKICRMEIVRLFRAFEFYELDSMNKFIHRS